MKQNSGKNSQSWFYLDFSSAFVSLNLKLCLLPEGIRLAVGNELCRPGLPTKESQIQRYIGLKPLHLNG